MAPRLFLLHVIEPGLALLPSYMTSNQSRVQLLSIASQESSLRFRHQLGGGTAVGYWQFQQDGVAGVLQALPSLAQSVLDACDVSVAEAYNAIQYHDPIACAFARLLLWSDPTPLPAIGNSSGAYSCYCKNWRPGRPDETRWHADYATACSTVGK